MKKASIFLTLLFIIVNLFSNAQLTHVTGALPIDSVIYKSIPLASTSGMGLLPSSYDLSEWFPSPGDQGQTQGSCVAFAACYALKSYQEAVERKVKPTDNTKLYSPSYIYNQIKLGGCASGSSLYRALELLKTEGVCTLNDFPYDPNNCTVFPNTSQKTLASNFKIADFRAVAFQNDGDVKTNLVSGFPIIFLMRVDDGFDPQNFNGIYNGPWGNERGNHSMVVVGYDDSKSAYKVLNSWGALWGTNGYCWISYSAFKTRVIEAYVAQDVINTSSPVLTNTITPNDLPKSNPVPNNTSVSLSAPNILHNQWGNSPQGLVKGMLISVPGTISNSQGAYGQLIVRFYNPNGTPLFANSFEYNYRDNQGLCAAGSLVLPIANNSAQTGRISLFIPYYALNFQNSNGTISHQVAAIASFYINNFEKAKSQLTNMLITY